MQTVSAESLKQIGGSEWQKGEQHRVYFNQLGYWYGIRTTRYQSGKIQSATLDGQPLSNNKAHDLLVYLDGGKVWFDVNAGQFRFQGLDREDGEFIVQAIRDAVEASEAVTA